MSPHRTIIRLSAVLAAVALAKGCGGDDSPTAPPTPEPARPTTVTVSPPTTGLTALGATVQLTAEVRDQNSRVMAGATVTWTSNASSVATVDAVGLVTAAGNGVATITATAGSASGSAVVTVTQSVVSVAVSPSETELTALGETVQLAAAASDDNGRAVAGAEFLWESSDAAVARVDTSGLVTGVAGGVATITASAGSASGSAVVTVMQPVASVLVAPPKATITALGDTLQLAAEAFDENGHAVAGAEFSWVAGDGSVATVDAGGLVTAVAEGTATITASAGAALGAAEITVFDVGPAGTDRAALAALYIVTAGPNWKNAENWLTAAPLGTWYGVETDSRGRVVGLKLGSNDLTGPIPPELGNLTGLEGVDLYSNGLTGPIPPELGNLTSLRGLTLSRNRLTGPIPPELGNLTGLTGLNLGDNGFTGPIPPELGNLLSLRELYLSGNALTGPIPPELGDLTNLGTLYLSENDLTGPLPPELGSLTSLRRLELFSNHLAGPIPPELGNLTGLEILRLEGNSLTGPVPPEFGDLTNLGTLYLSGNDLTGPIPPELGRMSGLRHLDLSNNSGLAGPLPTELSGLGQLETLLAAGTDLCAPDDPGFRAWLGAVGARIPPCVSGDLASAYLTQAVQSRKYPVPLVAGEKALLRVFVTAASPTTAGIPPVRARFYLDGAEIHVADIPARAASIPTEIHEGDLSRSANAEIPGGIVQPGLEMVVEIDPAGTLDDPGLRVARRIPETGRLAVDVREMPALDLTVIPFLWIDDPHWEAVETVEAMEADPEGHELLWHTRTLLPIGDLEVTAHTPVLTSVSYDEWYPILDQTEAIRAIEGGSGHYMGTMSRPGREGQAGRALRPGRVFISRLNPTTMAHELGHNLSLYHAPCGGAGGPDPAFPNPDGSIGDWGYDFRHGGALVSPRATDLMSYCEEWIGEYHFANALRFRLFDEGPSPAANLAAQEAESLLLWGGMDAESEPFLNPAFVIAAPPALPDSNGAHRLTGRTAGGGELFSLGFAMPDVADGDGRSSFAFVLPVEPGWAGSLASVTLSGPGGSVALDGGTDLPMTILLDPGTGQVRGILHGPPQTGAGAAAAPPGLDAVFSRGIPDAAAWSR